MSDVKSHSKRALQALAPGASLIIRLPDADGKGIPLYGKLFSPEEGNLSLLLFDEEPDGLTPDARAIAQVGLQHAHFSEEAQSELRLSFTTEGEFRHSALPSAVVPLIEGTDRLRLKRGTYSPGGSSLNPFEEAPDMLPPLS